MQRLRLTTAGESHGPELTAILEGLPYGVELDFANLTKAMDRRRRGLAVSARMSIENDDVSITAGVINDVTTGAPIALRLANRDRPRWRDRDVAAMTVPRPGHADLVGALKYGYPDLRFSLERASARETAARTAAAFFALEFLRALDVKVGGFVSRIGAADADLDLSTSLNELNAWSAGADKSLLAWPIDDDAEAITAIELAQASRDTVGGEIVAFVSGLPPGLGSFMQWDLRLDGAIARAAMSIPSCKGVEIGPAFAQARLPGTRVHDAITKSDAGTITRGSNRAGGLEGGVTTGEPLVVRAALKPISTTLTAQDSVDLKTGAPTVHRYERSDTCAVTRAVPILEAMLALVVADAILVKVGGDSLDEVKSRFAALPRGALSDFDLHGNPWRLRYPEDDQATASNIGATKE